MAWNCVLCSFSALYLYLLLSHLNTNHNDGSYFAFCGIDGCVQNFQRANSFSRHVREKHGAYLNSQRENVVLELKEMNPVSSQIILRSFVSCTFDINFWLRSLFRGS